MYSPMRKDYVSLTLRDQYSHNYTNGKQWRRQSCWRVRLAEAEYKVEVENQWLKMWLICSICLSILFVYSSQ